MWNQIKSKIFKSTIPVINIHGLIYPEMTQRVVARLNQVKNKRIQALVVSVNSTGGSPVQSQIISEKLRNFADKRKIPLYTFAKDYATSGGYFILSIGDEVYADKLSVVGNIGVYIPKFHLKGLIEMANLQTKYFYTKKNSYQQIINPFNQIDKIGKQIIQQLCIDTHQKFKQHICKYRSSKLKSQKMLQIMSGQTYSGQVALQNGLVDGLGSYINKIQQKYPNKQLQYAKEKGLMSVIN